MAVQLSGDYPTITQSMTPVPCNQLHRVPAAMRSGWLMRSASGAVPPRSAGHPAQLSQAAADWASRHSRPSGPAVRAISVAGLSHSMLSRSSGYCSAPTCAVPEPAAT